MKKLVLFLCSAVIFAGCFTEGAPALPGKVGPAGEVLVVCTEKVWNGPIGAAISEYLDRPYEVLPQIESQFDIVVLDPSEYDRFWKPHRNILFIDVADRLDTKEPDLSFYRNRYSNGQIYVEAKGRTEEAVAGVIQERGEELLSLLHAEEIKRVAALVKAYENEAVAAALIENHGFTMNIPRDAVKVMDNEEFIWIQRELTRMKGADNHDIKQGIFIYSYPYTSDTLFSYSSLLQKRNEFLERYVKGEIPGSYMSTQMRVTPRYEEIAFNGKFAAEMRGLWRMEGDFMGGPFYMLSFLDEKTNRVITLDGYAYAPYFDKREYIREVEAILRSFRFQEPEAKAAN